MSVLEGGRLVAVDDEQVASAWLRDACHCPACRHPRTNERLLDSRSISPDLTATSTRIDGQFLCVELSDGHLARVPLALVLDPAQRGRPADPMAGRTATATATDAIWSCDAHSLELDDGVGELCDRLWSDGVVLVTGVEPTENGLRGVAERIGHIEPTNFGAIWSIDASPEPDSAVDSVRGLLMHSDLPYRQCPAGVQCNLGVQPARRGGASTFVDAYAMAERLRTAEPLLFELLTTISFRYPYRRAHTDLDGSGPLLALNPDGTYGIARRAPDLVGSPIVDADRFPDVLALVRRWGELVDDPANHVEVVLGSGDLAIFDNHRMLHGRTAFELDRDRPRRLLGCYLAMDELRNRRRLLHREQARP